MVKPDVKVNYYAALELSTDASVDDVKKQYRKLALKYHPDRNPGKEEEYIPKFQAISAAHEVLSDPTTKTKYDADRRSAGISRASTTASRPSAYGQRGNPYTANTTFQPPPRRTADPTGWAKRPTATSSSASGADRFANFPGPGPTSKQGANKTSAYDAWSSMRDSTKDQKPAPQPKAPGARRPPPVPPRGPAPATPPRSREDEIKAGVNHKPAPFTSAAYAHFNPERQTPRRGGFDPNTPGSDERPPAGPSSYNTSNREREFAQTKPPQYDSSSEGPSAAQPKRPSFAGPNRTTSAYPNVGGERTYVSSDDLRRSTSVRDATDMPRATDARHRSSSPPKPKTAKSAAFTMPEDSDDSSSSGSSAEHGAFGSRPRPKKVPISRLGRQSTNDNGSSSHPQQSQDQHDQADGVNKPSQNNIFTIPTGVDGLGTPQQRSTTEINTSFSPSGGAPIFTGSPTTKDFPPTPVSRRGSPAKRGRSYKSSSSMHEAFARPSSSSSSQPDWPNFQFGGPSADGETTGQKGTTEPQPATIHDTSDESDTQGTSAAQHATTPDAMDIDQTPPAQSTSARPVAVPPSQWRQAQEMPPPPRRHSTAQPSAKAATTTGRPSSSSGAMPSLNGLGESLNAATGSGLHDFSSLNESIPFPSQPSSTHPSKLFNPPTPLSLPECPKAPFPPQMLSKTSWRDYTAKMLAYLAGPWHDFQLQLATHNADTLAIEEQLLFKGPGGLEARGETSSDVSVDAYLARCKEQERWAELQAMAYSQHNSALERFARTKLRVRELAEAGRLVE